MKLKKVAALCSSANAFCLFDRVELNGKKGWISGFTGTSCYMKDAEDNYIRTSGKYNQVSLSKHKILRYCGNWVIEMCALSI